ncbi:nicotinamide riboside transporter PnuC [Lactococcus allomyrinae]|uniref:Nicotinamide mononucleotide transporter n=1 Tax=Lactococcus allomyrinae TaxID=2419773 RepID=A0A387BGP6_9LACT|nr:nicotinamide riboside transporter PnuC [Lactococcus allomyrinae]AYG00306.1 nicotinamide mononucleotide transporter [Lactococcus allomyrinae]
MMNTKLKILSQGMSNSFNPKVIIKELTTLSIRDYILLAILLLSQIVAYLFSGTFDLMSNLILIVEVFTIVNLILVNRGRLTNYTFGLIATIFWFIVAAHARLVGDMFSQSYYLVMQFIGIYAWQKDLSETHGTEVTPKKITRGKALLAIGGFAVIYGIVLLTSHHLGGQQIFLDATLLPLAIISQLLMTYGYRSQWLGWILIDVINVVIWFNAWQSSGNSFLGMFILQIAMLVNAFYGAYLWFTKDTMQEVEAQKI